MPVAQTAGAVHEAVVVDRREPAPGIVVLGLRASALAEAVRPGQFVMAVLPGGERAAVPLAVYESSGSRVSLMIVVVGARTAIVAERRVGDALVLVGPLGNGFDADALGRDVAIVAGGVGIASLLLLAADLVRRGRRAHLYYGARSAAALVGAELYAAAGAGVSCATDDGTRGHHGFVTDLLEARLGRHDAIAACGPTPMLRAVARIANDRRVPAQLSLEEAFACGVGACWGCVVPLDRNSAQAPAFPAPPRGERREYVHARTCREGPVFWAHELRW
jgi:dihydroorotate dehydrogenase electron transfer subunit